jgi:hypothetical protein
MRFAIYCYEKAEYWRVDRSAKQKEITHGSGTQAGWQRQGGRLSLQRTAVLMFRVLQLRDFLVLGI